MFDSHDSEGYDGIVKSQKLYQRLMECESAVEFKKIFGTAIQEHSLDEFYPVVVRAELSAALMLCHFAASQVQGFHFRDYLMDFCAIRPAQLINLPLQAVSDITETPVNEIELILRAFGYTVTEGKVADHPGASGTATIIPLDNKRQTRNAG